MPDVVSAVVAVATAGCLFFVPGVLVAVALGLRGFLAVFAAPMLSLGAYGLSAAVLGTAGVRWSPASVGVSVVVVVAVAALVGRRWRFRAAGDTTIVEPSAGSPSPGERRLGQLAGVVAWATVSAVAARTVVRGSRDLAAPQQYWDAIFHANAIRSIAESGNIAPRFLAPIAQPDNAHFFYPDLFHGLGALLMHLGQSSVPVVINAMLAVLPAVFAASVGFLAWVLFGRPVVALAAVILATAVTSFPYDLFYWGPLWAFATALSIAPAVAGFIILLLRRGQAAFAVASVLGVVAVGSAQPAGGVAAVLMAVVLGIGPLWARLRELDGRRAVLRHLGLIVGTAFVALLASLPTVRGLLSQGGAFTSVHWPALDTPGAAVGQLLTFNQESQFPQWWIAVLLGVGIMALVLRRLPGRALLVLLGLFLGLYVLADAYDIPLSHELTSVWWNDKWRLAAMFAAPAVVVAAAGVQWITDVAGVGSVRLLRRARAGWSRGRLLPYGATALVLLVVALATTVGYGQRNEERVALGYTDGPTFSQAEARGYQVLAERYDHAGTIMNDPFDGSAWAYAYFQLPLVFKSPLTAPFRPQDIGLDRLLLLGQFNKIDTDAAVRRAADELDVRWVVVSSGFVAVGQTRAPGLTDLDNVKSLQLVYRDAETSVYRLVRHSPI